MTYSDAADYYKSLQAKDKVLNEGSFLDQAKGLGKWTSLANKQPPKPRKWTFLDVAHGMFGAGIGAGIAKGVSSVLPLGKGFADKLETAAMGIGAAMNTGAIKWASDDEASLDKLEGQISKVAGDRKNAFRLGFMKAAQDKQLIKEAMLPVPLLSVGIGDILSLPRAAAKAVTGAGRVIGNLAGTIDAPDETEEAITKMEMDRMMLEEQLQGLRSDKRNKVLREVLAKRGK